ncbi:hypothetical protein [Terribacillus aidingensis]
MTEEDKKNNEIVYKSGTRYEEIPSNKISVTLKIGEDVETIQLNKE